MDCTDFLKVYRRGEKFLVLNPLVPTWIVTNVNGVLLVKIFAETQSLEATREKFGDDIPARSVENFLDKVRGAGLFTVPTAPLIHKPYTLRAIYLNMTERCNLRCVYCFAAERVESGARLNFDNYKKILDAVKRRNPNAEIIFTGGEPLLSELTLPVAEYSKTLGFANRLMTNATLIEAGNVGRLAELFGNVRISLDGSDAGKHDFYRGRGSFERTTRAIDLLEKCGVDVSLAMVVTKKNLGDVATMSKRWGSRLIFQPLFPLGNAKENRRLYLSGKEYFDALKSAGVVPYVALGEVVKRRPGEPVLKCALGDAEVSISCSGDVYPCQLLHFDAFKVGNLHEKTFDEIYDSDALNRWKMHTTDCIDRCKDCDLKLLCGGACQARHFSETKNLDAAGDFCEYERNGIIDGLIQSATLQAV